MTAAVLTVFAVISVVTWQAVRAKQPERRRHFARLLLLTAIASTVGLALMGGLFFLLMKSGPNSPAGLLPALLAIPCAVVAAPSWIGFATQAILKKQQN